MAKFQLCEFRRVPPPAALKSDPKNKWERGLACVREYGWHEVDYIIDDEGDKVKTLHDFRLVRSYHGGVIDTEDKMVTY